MQSTPRIFLDCDGVLADFDMRASEIFGMNPFQAEEFLGSEKFWSTLQSQQRFYRNLPLMQDAEELFGAVKHLQPIILTGCPKGGWAEQDKLEWAAEHFAGVKMVTCKAADKRLHMQPGDILIDDRTHYRHLWEEAGGIFVVHLSANETIAQLRRLGILEGTADSGNTKGSHVR